MRFKTLLLFVLFLHLTVGGLAAQTLLVRGGVDVYERPGKFGLDAGAGAAGLGEKSSFVFSLTPRYEFWRRGERSLDLALPIFYVLDLGTVGVGDLELERGAAWDIAPSLELALASQPTGRNCCLRPSFFLGAGVRIVPEESTGVGDERFRLASRTSPLVTAGAALEARWKRGYAWRLELRVMTVFEDDARLKAPFGEITVAGENVTTGLLTIGLGVDF